MKNTRMFERVHALCGVALIVMAGGCANAEPPTAIPAFTETSTISANGFTRVEGKVAGALYAVIRPDDWNGDVVVLMHGTVAANAPISLDPPLHWWWNAFTDALVERGFGVAFSSYRANGFAVQEGTIDTWIARAMFRARFGKPRDTYLAGWSLGTYIGQKLVETGPGRYAGFLSVCGGLGGTQIQRERYFDTRVAFDYFFPGVLPGNVRTSELDFLQEVLPTVVPAVSADIATAVKLASIDQLYIDWSGPEELALSIAGSLFGGTNTRELQARAHGFPFDNTETEYTSEQLTPAELEALNEGVDRFAGDRRAFRYLDRNYSPNGRQRGTKVLSVHTSRDPLLPVDLHMPAYEQLLASAGNENLHVLRLIDGFGHCEFGFDAEPDPFLDIELEAFDDLVAWVRSGVKPMP